MKQLISRLPECFMLSGSTEQLKSATSRSCSSLSRVTDMTRLLIPLALVFAVALHADAGVVVEYEAEGTVEYRTTDSRTATVFMSQECNFRMSVSGARWFLVQFPTRSISEGQASPMEAYSVASSDGTNFYFVIVAPEAAAGKAGNARAANARNVAAATIRSGSVPVGTVPSVGLLWYALASGAYFERDVTNEYVIGVSPFPDRKYYLKDFRTKAFWELEAQPPRLPRKLTFTGDYMFLHQQPDPGFQQHLRPINWMYQSIEFTNVGDLWLPKQGAASLADSGPLQTTFRFAVTNLNRACSVAMFEPKFPGATAVSDYRAISTELPVGVAAGVISDWPKAEATKARAATIMRDRHVVGMTHSLRWVRWGVGLFFLLPLAALCYYAFQQKSKLATPSKKKRKDKNNEND